MAEDLAWLEDLLDQRDIKGLDRLRARGAAAALRAILGHLPREVVPEGPLTDVGRIVRLSDEDADWVIFHAYLDGAFDLIREGATSMDDLLWGWETGQTFAEHRVSIDQIELQPIPQKKPQPTPMPLPKKTRKPRKRARGSDLALVADEHGLGNPR